jgi:hypothetical protein
MIPLFVLRFLFSVTSVASALSGLILAFSFTSRPFTADLFLLRLFRG